MSPRSSTAAWRSPVEPPRLARRARGWAVALMLCAGAVVMLSYLAGYVLLLSLRQPVRTATPLTVLRYAYYYADHPHIRARLVFACSVAVVTSAALAGVVLLPRRASLHGDARFASRREIASAGLLGDEGIILGRVGRRLLRLHGQQGVALAAPPRSGKGVGVVIPNALYWPGSLVCVDIKRENWTLTAGFRARCGQACYLFDPFAEDGRTARWNPFFYVSKEASRRINDLQRIADMLYPEPPNVDPFWAASARSLFLGVALYLFETPSLPTTIGEVLRQGMASDAEGFGAHWKRVIEERKNGPDPLSPQCVRALCDVIDLAPVTASSIRKTFTSRLDLWLNPILDAATAGNDFDLRDLRKRPLSIYVGANPDDLKRLRPVLSLFFEQAIGLQTRDGTPERNPTLNHQVPMLLDEFTALGRIPIMADAISYLPGYNVRVALVIQTPAQLREVYGADVAETMLKSLAAKIVYAPKDFNDAREISDELGFNTVKARSVSKPGFDLGASRGHRGRSVSVSEQRRAPLLPQEVKALGRERAIIFYEGLPPLRCHKIRYFRDRRFKERVVAPPPLPASTVLISQPCASSGPNATAPQVPARAGQILPLPARVELAPGVRDATVEDIERWEQLTLDDYAADFSTVPIPQKPEGERMTPEEIKLAVEAFLRTVPGTLGESHGPSPR